MMNTIVPTETQARLIEPYGGRLVDLLVAPEEHDALRAHANTLPSIQLSDRALCDLELLATGAFSPLDRFMGRADYERVVAEMRLADGTLFPIPVTLPVERIDDLHYDREIALRDSKNNLLAVMTVEEIYTWERAAAAQQVFGTQDPAHPLVAEMTRWGSLNLSGPLRARQCAAWAWDDPALLARGSEEK